MSGKGDGYRPVDREKFSANWDRIFANKQDRETDSAVLHPQSLRKEDCVKHLYGQTERCDKTVDIEELIEASKDAEK